MADFPAGLAQPDERSCGAACLVVARALDDAAYLARVASPAGFRAEVLGMHTRTTSLSDVTGQLQPPWPRALGTPPWAVARQLTGATGTPHAVRPVRWSDGEAAYDGLVDLARPAALYVGSRWLPRHVVLVLEGSPVRLRIYEPSHGAVVTVGRERFVDQRLALAGWDVRWFSVVPGR